jgi:hypothetical protein
MIYTIADWVEKSLEDEEQPDAELTTGIAPDLGDLYSAPQALSFEQIATDLTEAALDAEADAATLGEHIKALQERKQRMVARGHACRARLLQQMQIFSRPKYKEARFTLSVTHRAGRMVVVDLEKVPAELCRIKVEPNMTAIQEQFKTAGEIPPGCDIGPETESVTIRVA